MIVCDKKFIITKKVGILDLFVGLIMDNKFKKAWKKLSCKVSYYIEEIAFDKVESFVYDPIVYDILNLILKKGEKVDSIIIKQFCHEKDNQNFFNFIRILNEKSNFIALYREIDNRLEIIVMKE